MARKRSRATIAPRLDACEPRILMSLDGGVNLSDNQYWSPAGAWVDVTRELLPWGMPDAPWQTKPGLVLTSQGYPTSDAATGGFLAGDPDGVYHLSYKGTATPSAGGIGAVTSPVVVGADGVSRADVTVKHNPAADGWFVLTFKGVDPADPPRDIRLIQPGYAPDAKQTFTDAFLRRLQPFSTIRAMDWERINNFNTVTTWADRTAPDQFLQTDGAGVAYEYIVELANEARKDLWINVPALADDDHVRQLARLARDQLNPGLKLYVEYGNENWNTYFPQYHQILDIARLNPRVTATDEWTMVAQQSADRLKAIGDIFRDEFGARSSSVKTVLGGFTIVSYFAQAELDFIAQTYGDPSLYVSALGITNYLGMVDSYNQPGMTLDDLFAGLEDGLAWMVPGIKANKAVAGQYKLPLVAYEGGQGLINPSNNPGLGLLAQNDPRMARMYRELNDQWEALGGGLMMQYSNVSTWRSDYYWGLLDDISSPGTSKWDGMISSLLAPGDATLDHKVDASDFAILAAHIGQPGTWYWEQGDFNHDNAVDASDLDLLRANLGPVAPAQAVGIALFDAPMAAGTGTTLVYNRDATGSGLTYAWNATADGVTVARSSGASFAFTPRGPGRYVVSLSVSDATGKISTGETQIVVSGASLAPTGNLAIFDGLDRSSMGGWIGTFGSDGYLFPGGAAALPSYVSVNPIEAWPATWKASTADPRVPRKPLPALPTDRSATTYYTNSAMSFDISASDGQAHRLTVYALDYDHQKRAQRVELLDGTTGAVIDSRVLSSFENGVYASWQVRGHVLVRVTPLAGSNAVIGGVFLDTNHPSAGDDNISTASAAFHGRDDSTSGSWINAYGVDGYQLAGGEYALPAYASLSLAGAGDATWAARTAEIRAPLRPAPAPSNDRRAACVYGMSSFTYDLQLTDGKAHRVAFYLLDYDRQGRSERIELIDAASGTVLDRQDASSFAEGAYLSWVVRGHVQIRFTTLSGPNAVVSAVFFDDPNGHSTAASFAGRDDSASGTWAGLYGSEGYLIAAGDRVQASGVAIQVMGSGDAVWAYRTADLRALQRALPAPSSDRLASCEYSQTSLIYDVNVLDGKAHRIAFYAVDFDRQGRSQRFEVTDADTGVVLDSRDVASFTGGAYLSWITRGHVRITVTCLSGPNAVISGVFVDPAAGRAASATFDGQDARTRGDWLGRYGSEGYQLAASESAAPAYATVQNLGTGDFIWADKIPDPRALRLPWPALPTDRRASCVYSATSFTYDVALTDGQAHKISLYFLDFDRKNRGQRVEVIDAGTGEVLDTRNLSSFEDGIYLSWTVKGHVRIRVTSLDGPNAVCSGLFFDAPG